MAYQLPPEGTYWGNVESVETDSIGKNETPCVSIIVEMTHRFAGDDVEADPLQGSMSGKIKCFLSEGAWPISEENLKSVGFNGDFEKPAIDTKYTTEGAWFICEHQEHNGKQYANWRFADWGGGKREVKPIAKDEARRLNALWKQSTKPAPAAPVTPAASTKSPKAAAPKDPPPPPSGENDVPAF